VLCRDLSVTRARAQVTKRRWSLGALAASAVWVSWLFLSFLTAVSWYHTLTEKLVALVLAGLAWLATERSARAALSLLMTDLSPRTNVGGDASTRSSP
jgi:hypothetical protein